jgi:hypothetical protein
MYKASRPPMGGPAVFEGQTADDERDRERLERSGFVYGGQGAALEALDAREFELAELAANRVIPEQRMSPKAQAEAEAVDLTTIQHLGAIPEAGGQGHLLAAGAIDLMRLKGSPVAGVGGILKSQDRR